MKHWTSSLILAGALSLTGCLNVVSLNSMVGDEQAVMDPALLGLWTNADGKETCLIGPDGTSYSIRYWSSDSSDTYQFKARLMRSGDVRLLDLESAKDDPFRITVHVPVRVWLEGSTARVAFLQTDWLKDQARRQMTTAPGKDFTLITASSEAVRVFLTTTGTDANAYDDIEVFHRVQ